MTDEAIDIADFSIERQGDEISFTRLDAPERSTGWKDSAFFQERSGEWFAFDAEANEVTRIETPPAEITQALALFWDHEHVAEEDARAYARGPHAYYGVRESDFH